MRIAGTLLAGLPALLLALAPPAEAVEPVPPLTEAQLVDERTMVRIADALDLAVDAKRWAEALAYFTTEVFVDLSSLGGAEPATVPAETLVDGWAEALAEPVESFHLRGNHVVLFRGERAVMTSNGYAWNASGDALWEVWGVYEYGFVKVGGTWRIDRFVFRAVRERGDRL